MNLSSCLALVIATGWIGWVPNTQAASGGAESLSAQWQWRRARVRRGVGSEAITALAMDPTRGQVAVGGADGVSLLRDGELEKRLSRVGAVTDLAFAADGTLWIGTSRRLWSYAPDGRLVQQYPGQGEEARFVRRVSSLRTSTLVTTDAGAYVRTRQRSWRRLGADLPRARGGAVALRRSDESSPESRELLEAWLVLGTQLWKTLLPVDDSGSAGVGFPNARVVTIPGVPVAEVPVQIVFGLSGVDVLLVYPRLLVFRTHARAPWTVVRPVRAAEAGFTWFAHAGDRFWLASEGGILCARSLDGRWWRAASPVGYIATNRILPQSASLLAATEWGLYEGWPQFARVSPDVNRRPATASHAGDPGILAIQQEALRYQGLEPGYMRRLRQGVALRGWWPEVSFRLQSGFVRERGIDFDQAYLSGGKRRLQDRERADATDIDAQLMLSWDLGDVAFNPETVDLSREARQVISLRDDVLDQVNQLYYERQAILLTLAQSKDSDGTETSRLWLRAAELAAGLDGWTGGWFRRQLKEPRAGEGPLP